MQAHLRRCSAEGVFAHVAKKGDPDAGQVFIKVYLGNGRARLRARMPDDDGRLVWQAPIEECDGAAEEAAVDAYLAREAKFDPDFWIIEIEDPQGRTLLDHDAEGF